MKRRLSSFISIFLVIIMAITPVTVFCEENAVLAEQAEEAVQVQTEYEEPLGLYEMNFLNSLGIVSFTEGMLTQAVTNEEFAGALGLIGGMVSNYYQSGALDMLVRSGYLPSACEYPHRNIKYMQAVKGMVSVLGYDAAAQNQGGYPNGYIIQASKLKIIDGLDVTDNETDLTYGMMCIMMYNSLDVIRVVQTVYGPNATYEKEDTVLNGVFEIYEEFGRVTANSVTSLDGVNTYNPQIIKINGVEFKNSNSAYDDLFGYNVRYYYKETAGKYELLYMELDKGGNKIIETGVNDGSYVKDKKLFYYTENKKLKTAYISDGYCLVYNKRVTSKGLENYESSLDGYIKMADTDRDGKYDFIEINSYDTIYVSRINSYDSAIFDKYDDKKSASFDEKNDDTKYIIKDDKGNDIAFSAIKKGNVVSVIMSEDGEVGVAIVSASSETLNIDAISRPGSNAYIYSGDKKHPVSQDVMNKLGDIILGEEYKIFFDFSGYVAGFELSENVFEAGLIMGTDETKNGGLKRDVWQIKIFTEKEEVKIFDFAEKVTVDGKRYTENKLARDALYKTVDGKSVYKSKFIRYSLKNNEIINIDTAFYNEGVESENSLQLVGNEENKYHSRDGQCFIATDSSGFVYDSGLSVFFAYRVDLPENDESEYHVIKYTDIPTGVTVPSVTGYATSVNTPDVEYVVIGMTESYATQIQSNYYITLLFDSVTKKIDGDGEEKYCIYGLDLAKNVKITQLVDDITKLNGIEKGDILNIRFTLGGAIGGVYKAYDAKTDKVLFRDASSLTGTSAGTSNSAKLFHGRAYSAGSSYVYILPESMADKIDTKTIADCKMVAMKRRQPNCYIYDTTESKDKEYLTPVSKDSINDYLNTGAGADRVLASTYASEYSAVIIFR